MHKKAISLNFVEKSLSHSADKIPKRTLLCFERNLVSTIFKQRRGEASRFCRKLFSSHRTEKTSLGNHSVFQKISGREKYLMDKRGGGGGVSRFSVEAFVSLYRNNSLESTLVFQKNSFIEIFKHRRGRGYTVLSKFFVSQDRNEKLCKGTLLFPEIFWYRKKFMDKRWHITIFSRNFYVSQCRKLS